MTTGQRTKIFAALSCAALSCVAVAQRDRTPKWKIDPYTKNDPRMLERFGYLSYGPFPFGQRGDKIVTTEDIDKHLSYENIIWVETPHFRIGSMLDKWSVPTEPKIKAKLRAELERMIERTGCDKIKIKPRVLDRWLRVHLTAQRMEELYAEIQDWLGVTDDDFPTDASQVIIGQHPYMGMGPFLGQPDKYLILVSESEGSMNEYMKSYTGRDTQFGQRWNFKLPGSLIYGVATEMEDNRLKHDTALHANLAFNISHNLIDGYRFYAYETPVWIKEGLAHWFERRVSPRWNTFDMNEGSLGDKRNTWKWEVATHKIIQGKKFTTFSEVYTWRDYGQIMFDDHIAIWSRWDYLMSLGKEKFAVFMKGVKGRIDEKTWLSDETDLVGATRDALRDAYGLSPLTIDEQWIEFVKENYPTR